MVSHEGSLYKSSLGRTSTACTIALQQTKLRQARTAHGRRPEQLKGMESLCHFEPMLTLKEFCPCLQDHKRSKTHCCRHCRLLLMLHTKFGQLCAHSFCLSKSWKTLKVWFRQRMLQALCLHWLNRFCQVYNTCCTYTNGPLIARKKTTIHHRKLDMCGAKERQQRTKFVLGPASQPDR